MRAKKKDIITRTSLFIKLYSFKFIYTIPLRAFINYKVFGLALSNIVRTEARDFIILNTKYTDIKFKHKLNLEKLYNI